MINPKISIVIPVYNGSNYMAEAINSALNQEYDNFEVLVINDGSNDNGKTEDIALSYGDKIKYYKKENGGVASALNFAIEHMEGEYFSWLSHDDIYYPDKLKIQIEALQKNGDMLAIVYGDYDFWYFDIDRIHCTDFTKSYSIKQLTNSIFPILQFITISSTPLIHRTHFDRIGLFDEALKVTQDQDFWFRLFRGSKIVFIEKPLLKSRIHNESGTNTVNNFRNELGTILTNQVMSVSKEELDTMFSYPAVIYHRMAYLLKSLGLMEHYRVVKEQYMKTEVPCNLYDLLKSFESLIKSLSGGIAKRVVIFGAGNFGKRLYHDLKSRLVYVEYFVDNNEKLWGQSIEGCPCISPKELLSIKKSVLVLVASRIPEPIVLQLKQEGLPHIATKQELEEKISQTPPLKWVDAFEMIEGQSQGINLLNQEFGNTIFDMCKNYNM